MSVGHRHLVAAYLAEVEAATPDPVPLPKGSKAKAALLADPDAMMEAITALRERLNHPNQAVARAAAFAILDLEKARLKHGPR